MRKTIAAAIIVLFAAACGSNGSNDETTASTTATVVEETTTTEAPEAPVENTTTTEVVVEEPVLEAPVEQPAPPVEAGHSPQITDPFNPPAGPNQQELMSMTATERVHPDLLVNVRAVPFSSLESVGGILRAGVIGNDCTRGHSIHLTETGMLDPTTLYRADVIVGELADCTPTVDGLHLAVTGGPAPSGYWAIDPRS